MDGSADQEQPDETRPGRRGVLRAAGALGAAAVSGSVLADCSGSSTAAGGGEVDGRSGGTAGEGIPLTDVPVGGGTVVAVDKVVVTQPAAGTYKAFDSTCPHQGCSVSMVTANGIVCPCHGSVFDPATGERRSGPAQTGLKPRAVSVSGGRLTVS